jgi:hypothetical protein
MSIAAVDVSLVNLVRNDASVVSLAGSRIYATQATQGAALPLVVYVRDEGDRRDNMMHMTGSTGIVKATYTFSCLATTLLASRNLARAVRRSLQYKRPTGIRLVRVVGDADLTEAPASGDQLPTYRTDLTVEVTYIETV